MDTQSHYAGGGEYLKAAHLQGKKPVLTISGADLEDNFDKNGKQVVLSFEETEKRLTLNTTNWRHLTGLIGSTNTDDWLGVKIKIYATTDSYNGKTYDVIRLFPELPEQPEIKKKNELPLSQTVNSTVETEEIPF